MTRKYSMSSRNSETTSLQLAHPAFQVSRNRSHHARLKNSVQNYPNSAKESPLSPHPPGHVPLLLAIVSSDPSHRLHTQLPPPCAGTTLASATWPVITHLPAPTRETGRPVRRCGRRSWPSAYSISSSTRAPKLAWFHPHRRTDPLPTPSLFKLSMVPPSVPMVLGPSP